MNTTWETTIEDVERVLEAHGLDQLDVVEVHDELDKDAIEDAALYGDEMEEQTYYALQEIEFQLRQQGHITTETTKFPIP